MLDCGLGARFIKQLMFDRAGAYYVFDAREVVGGVRAGLWDNRQPIEATAMALLAVTELQQTLSTDSWRKRAASVQPRATQPSSE